MIDTISKWGPTYHVEADLVVNNSFSQNHMWTNVFHFTNGSLSNMIPLINVYNDNLQICAIVNSINYCHIYKYEPNETINILIKQTEQLVGRFYFEIIINDESRYKVQNQEPEKFQNIKVYASDPWHFPFDGCLENLKYVMNESGVKNDYSLKDNNNFIALLAYIIIVIWVLLLFFVLLLKCKKIINIGQINLG